MTPGTSPDRRAEVRLPVYGRVSLLVGSADHGVAAELIDVSACGFHIRYHHLAFAPSMVLRLKYELNEARVRAVWSRGIAGTTESGLLREEVYLIHGLRTGDGECFLQLVSPYLRSVRGTLRGILHNREDSEDVLQECLMKVLAHINQFHPGQSFRAWLLQIATNEALKYVRNNRKYRYTRPGFLSDSDENEYPDELIDPGQSPEDALEGKEFRRAVSQAIESLNGMYRQVVEMRELEDLGMEEIAARLGINLCTANTRLHRARLRLREQLKQTYFLHGFHDGKETG